MSSEARVTRATEAGKRQNEDATEGLNTQNKKKTVPSGAPSSQEHEGISNNSKLDNPSGDKLSLDNLDSVNVQGLAKHMALVISKLDNIENNTAALNLQVSTLSSKVEGHSDRISQAEETLESQDSKMSKMSVQLEELSARIKRTETAAASQSKVIHELAIKQNSIIDDVNQNVGKQINSTREVIQKDNELFRGEIINLTNRNVNRAVGDLREDFAEEKGTVRILNLIIVGLQESQEVSDWDAVSSLFSNTMGVKGAKIDVLYRMGKQGGTGPKPILVRFKHLVHRNKVWFAKSKLKLLEDSKIFLQEDISKEIRDAQRTLYPTFRKAKSMSETFKSVKLKGIKLILDGEAFGVNDRDKLPAALRPASMATVSSESVVVFFGKASPLSNHHPSTFHAEGHRFESVEQYLAWHRAKIAGREKLITKALKTTNPAACKGILNELKNTNSAQWQQSIHEIIISGLRAKFSQNPSLAEFLRNTHPKTLGEASTNPRWGIGLPLNNPNVLDTSKWLPEGNLLGKSLSTIREELVQELLINA